MGNEVKVNDGLPEANVLAPQEVPEATAETTEVDWKAKFEDKEKQYKGLQTNLNKAQRELEIAKVAGAGKQEIAELKSQVNNLHGLMAKAIDSMNANKAEDFDLDNAGKKQPSIYDEYKAQQAQADYQKQWDDYYGNVVTEMQGAIEEAEIPLEDERLNPVVTALKSKDYNAIEKARNQLPRLLVKINKENNKKMESDLEARITAMVDEKVKTATIRGGGFRLDSGGTGSPDLDTLLKTDDRDYTHQQRLKYKEQLQVAMKKSGVSMLGG